MESEQRETAAPVMFSRRARFRRWAGTVEDLLAVTRLVDREMEQSAHNVERQVEIRIRDQLVNAEDFEVLRNEITEPELRRVERVTLEWLGGRVDSVRIDVQDRTPAIYLTVA
jgi:hypothetical protein